jgi:hypothetical protein
MFPITEETLGSCFTRSRQRKLQRLCSLIYSAIVKNMWSHLHRTWQVTRRQKKQYFGTNSETKLQTEWFISPATGIKQVVNFPLLKTTIILLEYHNSHDHRKLSQENMSCWNISGNLVDSIGNNSSYCSRKCWNKEQKNSSCHHELNSNT